MPTRMLTLMFILVPLLASVADSSKRNSTGGKTIYVDSKNGADGNRGSIEAPFKTIARAWQRISGGDHVYLRAGQYTFPRLGMDRKDIFDREVTFQASKGEAAIIQSRLQFGRLAEQFTARDHSGSYNANITFIGLTFADGVESYGARNLRFDNCMFNMKGSLIGEGIGKTALFLRGGKHVEVESCEFTQTAVGIYVRTHASKILNCRIHHISHDGIQVTGSRNLLIEGNLIYNLDDGASDSVPWSKHCDAIHVFMTNNLARAANVGVTIRGNVMYDIESQAIQFNNHISGKDHINRDFLIENNVFGPTGSPTFNNSPGEPVDNLTFRHNTFVRYPGKRVFTSLYRALEIGNYKARFSALNKNLKVYNNIFHHHSPFTASGEFRNNLIYSYPTQTLATGAIGRGSIRVQHKMFVSPGRFDGMLLPDSPARDAGTRLDASGKRIEGLCRRDRMGNRRDARPDIGAQELPRSANHRREEHPSQSRNASVARIYRDDFEDGTFSRDIWLEKPNAEGLAWVNSKGYAIHNSNDKILKRNFLTTPTAPGRFMILTEQGDGWRDYDFSYVGFMMVKHGEGALFLYRDDKNYYWIDHGSQSGGVLYRVLGGQQQKVAECREMRLPPYRNARVRITIRHVPGRLEINFGLDGKDVGKYTESDSAANAMFTAGRVGFRRDYQGRYHRANYDDVEVVVKRRLTKP